MKKTTEIAAPLYERLECKAREEEIRVSQLVDHILRVWVDDQPDQGPDDDEPDLSDTEDQEESETEEPEDE